MTEMRTTRDLYAAIVAERGGASAFSAVADRIAIALAHALSNPQSIDGPLVARLVDQLPPLVAPHGAVIHESYASATDEQLDEAERALQAIAVPGAPEPNAIVRELNIALCSIDDLRAGEREAVRLRDIAEQSEAMWRRMHAEANGELERVRVELDRVQLQLGKVAAASIAPSTVSNETRKVSNAPPSNVVPLNKYGALAAVNGRW
jgi:hypothetical protein